MSKPQRLRRIAIRCFIVFVVLLTAAWVFENWRGAKAWEEAKERAEAEGVSVVRADYSGLEIPDEENLLMNEIFLKEWMNWRK